MVTSSMYPDLKVTTTSLTQTLLFVIKNCLLTNENLLIHDNLLVPTVHHRNYCCSYRMSTVAFQTVICPIFPSVTFCLVCMRPALVLSFTVIIS